MIGPFAGHEQALLSAGGDRYRWLHISDLSQLAVMPPECGALLVIGTGTEPSSLQEEVVAAAAADGGVSVVAWTPKSTTVGPSLERLARTVVRTGGAPDVVRSLDRILSRSAAAAARDGSVVLAEGELRGALLGYPKGLVLLDEQERVLLANSLALRLLRISEAPPEGGRLPYSLRELRLGVSFADGLRVSVMAKPFSWNRRPATWVELVARPVDGEEETRRARRLHVDRLAAVGQMAASVAHEINNPVAYISANTDTVAEHTDRLETALRKLRTVVADDRKIAEAFDAVMDRLRVQETLTDLREITKENLQGAGRISAIVRDLKNFSRIEPDQIEVVSVNQIVNEACMLVAHQIRFKAKLVKKLGEVPKLPLARQKLGQVVINLLMNSAQAIPEGDQKAHRIQIQTWAEPDRVVVSVADTGCGIPEHLTKRIFEPFVTTKEKEGGTGLGLSLCADIVRQHGGDIRLYSALGQGSQFDVVLPLNNHLKPARRKARRAPARPPSASGRARILLIDDETMLLRAFSRLLAPHHDVRTASGGAEALEVLTNDQSFDVVICDLMMPEVDGPMLHEEVRRRWPNIEERMIFCSGGAFSPRVRSFAEQVRDRCIDKPMSLEQLSVAIDRIRHAQQDRDDQKSAEPQAVRMVGKATASIAEPSNPQ